MSTSTSMSSAVRNKIASYEAHSHGLRSVSPTSRATPTSGASPSRRGSPASSRGSNEGSEASLSKQQPQQQQELVQVDTSTSTTAASQNRISRIRQQQLVRDGKAHHTTNLMEKRKQMKERRMMQQKRAGAQAAAAATATATETEAGTSRVDLARRTEYSSNSPAAASAATAASAAAATTVAAASAQRANRLNNYPGSATRTVTPTADGEDEMPQRSRESGVQDSSPSQKGHSRMSKMQRMQKIKGYDHVKKNRYNSSQASTSPVTPSSVVASTAITTATTATTAVARNYPERTSFNQQQASQNRPQISTHASANGQPASASASTLTSKLTSQRMESPPVSPGIKDNATLSPSVNGTSFSHLHASSPRSGTDVFSESNYTPGTMDTSVEPVTDDEVTLTSVRRIMARNKPNSPGSQSHQYQQLQPQSHRHTEASSDGHFKKRNKKGRHESRGRTGDGYHNPIALPAGRDGGGLPSQPPGPYTRNRRNDDSSNLYRDDRHHLDWLDEEKSDKTGAPGGVFRTSSSSDYDTDGDISKNSKTSRQSNALEGPSQSQSQATDVNDFFTRSRYSQASRRMDDDDRTFDYGDRDDDSNGSASYATRRRKEFERRAREAAAVSGTKDPSLAPEDDDVGESPLINKDDVEHYTKSLDTPAMKMGAGVVGAATVGCIVLGPVGLLVGAAAVGIGVGVMQIPEKERTNLQAKAQKTFNDLHDKAVEASESISSSCATTYKDSGVADHFPQCLSGSETVTKDHESTRSDKGRGGNNDGSSLKGVPKPSSLPGPQQENGIPTSLAQNNDRLRNKKVAYLRNGRILSAGQIHGLDPVAQPRAWLDVVASANTTDEEKNEAMEEILILAKDKRRARIFLDEGILDSIIWTLSRYSEKVNANEKKTDWAHPEITPNERTAVKLAAMCCVTLGKAHCAAIHTEGDLLLMSLYERGTVPEERQVAQMLHEVPHHARITKTADPSIVEPSKEVFALKQLNLPQAEELARSIKEVADGKL